MADKTQKLDGCLELTLISVLASLLGSALAAAIVAMPEADGGPAAFDDTFISLFGIIFFFGIWIAIPVGLVIGIPLLAIMRRLLPKYAVLATLSFAIIGLLVGLAFQHFSAERGMGNAFIVFGACVGGMHSLVYSRFSGGEWRPIVTALFLTGVAVPSVTYAGESVQNLIESRRAFAARCADPYGSMAFVGDRIALEQTGMRADADQGKWHSERQRRSLYTWERWIPLDKTRMLIARDYAYVPSGFAGWITGGRRVERHCLSEKGGKAAAISRRYGFGQRPTLKDLED